jgi:hypothetical protein
MHYLNRQRKGRAIPVEAWTGPGGSKRLRDMKLVRLSALRTGRLNYLNAELNPICHLLALLGARHILHVSRIRVKPNYEISAFKCSV